MQGCCHKTSTKIPTHFSWQLGQFQGHARVHVGLPSQTTKSFWLFLQPIKNAVQKDCQYPKLTPFLFFKTCVSFCTCVCSKKDGALIAVGAAVAFGVPFFVAAFLSYQQRELSNNPFNCNKAASGDVSTGGGPVRNDRDRKLSS